MHFLVTKDGIFFSKEVKYYYYYYRYKFKAVLTQRLRTILKKIQGTIWHSL